LAQVERVHPHFIKRFPGNCRSHPIAIDRAPLACANTYKGPTVEQVTED